MLAIDIRLGRAIGPERCLVIKSCHQWSRPAVIDTSLARPPQHNHILLDRSDTTHAAPLVLSF